MIRNLLLLLIPFAFFGSAWYYALKTAPDVKLVLCRPETFKHCHCNEEPSLVDVEVCCQCFQKGKPVQFCFGNE